MFMMVMVVVVTQAFHRYSRSVVFTDTLLYFKRPRCKFWILSQIVKKECQLHL